MKSEALLRPTCEIGLSQRPYEVKRIQHTKFRVECIKFGLEKITFTSNSEKIADEVISSNSVVVSPHAIL